MTWAAAAALLLVFAVFWTFMAIRLWRAEGRSLALRRRINAYTMK